MIREESKPPLRRVMASAFPLVLLALVAAMPVARAAENHLVVSATVAKHASLSVLSQPPSLTITAAEIAQGYVDVPGPTRVVVKSNTRGGYMLMFEIRSDFVREVRIRGLGNDVLVGPDGGVLPRPAPGPGMSMTTLDVGFRLHLTAAAQQGTHAWPVQMSVTPL